MKLTYGQLDNSANAIKQILQEKLPPRIAMLIQRNAQNIERELKPYYDQRLELLKANNAVRDGGMWAIPPEKRDDINSFLAQDEELRIVEIDIDIQTIKESEIIKQFEKNNMLMDGSLWIRIGYMIEFENEDSKE